MIDTELIRDVNTDIVNCLSELVRARCLFLTGSRLHHSVSNRNMEIRILQDL